MNLAKHIARTGLGSARVSRVGDCVLAIANCGFFAPSTGEIQRKDCFGEAPKPAPRRVRYPERLHAISSSTHE